MIKCVLEITKANFMQEIQISKNSCSKKSHLSTNHNTALLVEIAELIFDWLKYDEIFGELILLDLGLLFEFSFRTPCILISMTQLLSHTIAHFTGPLFMLKANNQPYKKILGLVFS